jgi:hydrogenase-1 operon protein HyaF
MDPNANPSPAVSTLLQEVTVALDRLLREGEGAIIDLTGQAFLGEKEREELHARLGEGEVSATVEALGPTEVVETAYPGVWWVTYWNDRGEVVAERLEIARLPGILAAQETDIRSGIQQLLAELPEAAPKDAEAGPRFRWVED